MRVERVADAPLPLLAARRPRVRALAVPQVTEMDLVAVAMTVVVMAVGWYIRT